MDKDQLEFDFTEVCKCTETTSYDELCPACHKECLEWLTEQEGDDLEGLNYEEHA